MIRIRFKNRDIELSLVLRSFFTHIFAVGIGVITSSVATFARTFLQINQDSSSSGLWGICFYFVHYERHKTKFFLFFFCVSMVFVINVGLVTVHHELVWHNNLLIDQELFDCVSVVTL